MKKNFNKKLIAIILLYQVVFIFTAAATNVDEEDDILDEIIPHKIFKRKFPSVPKRQMIETPDYGQGGQFTQMAQNSEEQFAPANTEVPMEQTIPGLSGQSSMAEQGLMEQSNGQQSLAESLGQSQPQDPISSFSQPEASISSFSQSQSNPLQDMSLPSSSQQITNEGVLTGLPENTKGYDSSAVTETMLSGKGYRVTTDGREKANNLVKDVKNFNLWEYSVGNPATSTDQTAKMLQTKLQADDDLLTGKDSSNLNANVMANAQGSKIDQILGLFNSPKKTGSLLKGLGNLGTTSKGLLDTSTKGFTNMGKNMDLMGIGKGIGENEGSLNSNSGSLETALSDNGGGTGSTGNTGNDGVSVVTIPNTYSLEDEQGNSLGSSETNHKVEKPKALQLLKALLKTKLERQAANVLLKQQAAQKPSISPTKSLKEQLAMFLHHTDGGSNAEKNDNTGLKISKLDLKLLKFIKHMISKGKGKETANHRGPSESNLKIFMTALREIGKKEKSDDVAVTAAGKEDKSKKEDSENKVKDQKKGDNSKEKDVSEDKEAAKEMEKETAKPKEKENNADTKENSQDDLKTNALAKARMKFLLAKKLKLIQGLLEQVKPTRRSGTFFMDQEQPLGETAGMTSNSLMKYLEHETALLDQFQEGTQISDPALQLKKLANLMMKVASKAQTKDAYVDARRTTVSPTGAKIKGDGGEEFNGDGDKTDEKGSKAEDEESKNKEDEASSKIKSKEEKTEDKNSEVDNKSEKKEDNEFLSKDEKHESEAEGTKNAKNKDKEVAKNDLKEKFDEDVKSKKQSGDGDTKESEKVNKGIKLPEVSKTRNNKKLVEKMNSGDEKSEGRDERVDSSKDKEEKSSESKQNKDSDEKSESEIEKTKNLKGLPELTKIRNNGGKIVSKADEHNEKETSSFITEKEGNAEKEKGVDSKAKNVKYNDDQTVKNKSQKSSEKSKDESQKTDEKSKDKGQKSYEKSEDESQKADEKSKDKGQKSEEKSEVEGQKLSDKDEGKQVTRKKDDKEDEKEIEAECATKQNDESNLQDKRDKETQQKCLKFAAQKLQKDAANEQYDLYVTGKSNSSAGSEKITGTGRSGSTYILTPNHHVLRPQLPFLNPGNAHLDVLENDISLKQYLMKKGSKSGALKSNESTDEQTNVNGKDRLLQIKDVTTSIKNEISRRASKIRKIKHAQKQESEESADKVQSDAVPPAGQGGMPSRALAGSHTIKPMSRVQWKKFKELQDYKKLVKNQNQLRPSKGLMETGSLRHIAPLLADRLVDTRALRLAALARLLSIAKRRQRVIDVTASKKTLPGSEPSKKILSGRETINSNKLPYTTLQKDVTPMIKASVFTPLKSNAVLVPTSGHSKDTNSYFVAKQELVAKPATENSGLLPKMSTVERDSGIDPSDVTRSQLEKPATPSIKQVMDLLENQRDQIGEAGINQGNVTAGNGPVGNETNDVATKAKVQQGAAKDPTPVPNTLAPNDNKPTSRSIAKISTEYSQKPEQNITSMSSALNELEKIADSSGRKVTMPKTELENSQKTVPAIRSKIAPTPARDFIVPLHEGERGKAFIQKPDIRSIIRTLKNDSDTANFLLRKRSKIARVRKGYHLRKERRNKYQL